jgi:hypothetical protein
MINIKSPREIYSVILDEVNNLLGSLENQEEDEEILRAQKEASHKLNEFRVEIQVSLKQLEKNSEWNVFTMAFYGETNAGKSTLIETLRILMSEPEKMRERKEFARLLEEYNLIQMSIEECQKSIFDLINRYKEKIDNIEKELLTVSDQLVKKENEILAVNKEIDELETTAKLERKSSVRNFFLFLFGKHQTQIKIKERKNELIKNQNDILMIKTMQDKLIQSKEQLNYEIDKQKKELLEKKEQLTSQATYKSAQIAPYSDGKIIGDGRSDYTQTVISYELENNDQKFSLLDLPGIEGNEGPVLDNINNAVQKAHIVFYVTGKPTPPQTGDNKVEGTLEKIKKHLGQQTEVYSIFNKRVKNPNSLHDKLIDEDEAESLKELEETMRAHLGDQYRQCIFLSAYPAFLSQANCWQNEYETKKEKFVEYFKTPQLLLEKSRVQLFSFFLINNIVRDCKEKIKKSNFKKATSVLSKTAEELKQIQKKFTTVYNKLSDTQENTYAQLNNAIEILEGKFNSVTYKEVENFRNSLRNKIYSDIESEFNNKDFKEALERRTNECIKILQYALEKVFTNVINNFKEEVSDIINKYQKNADELLKVYGGINNFDKKFELNIDIKSGINWVGVLTSVLGNIAGIIILLSNPVGWVVIALSIVGALISIGKAIAGFFNHNYRKSQQRKAADENIEKIGSNIIDLLKKNLNETKKPVRSGIEEIKSELLKSINRVKMVNDLLSKAKITFIKLADSIKKEGGY